IPDVGGILGDGAVAGEPPGAGHVQDRLAGPSLPIRIQLAQAPVRLELERLTLAMARHEEPPRRPQENGVIERSQGTSARWCERWTCRSPAELQSRLKRMDRLYREVYPYRERRSRLEVFPNLVHSGRPYDRAAEAQRWEWSRVTQHVASIVPLR